MIENCCEKQIPINLGNSDTLSLRFLYITLLGIFICFSAVSICAQSVVVDSTEVKFRQSKSILNPDLDDNESNLDRMIQTIKEREDSTDFYNLKKIKVMGSASPEGSVEINRTLSQKRARNIFNYIGTKVPLEDSKTQFIFLGRDWNGLYQLVSADSKVPYREDVLNLLFPATQTNDMTPAESNRLLNHLKILHKGIPYRYLYTHQFPKLRYSKLFVEYNYLNPPSVAVDTLPPVADFEIPEPVVITETEIIEIPEVPEKTCRPFYMGLKTNLLSDALLLPNIGAEFYLGKNWSVVANWTYGWWDKNKTHWYWRAYGGDLAVRKWFGKAANAKPLTGHHLGIYAGVSTFDFEVGGVGYMGGKPGHNLWDRCMFTAGVEYGYSLPIAHRLNLDFTLGVGYYGGKIVKYQPKGDKYVWESTKKFNSVLPTKLEVSLVWLIGCCNHN